MPEFAKYREAGAYHWANISKNIRQHNAVTVARYELVLDLLGNGLRGQQILDTGCGDGVLSYLLAKRGAVVYGVDYSMLGLQHAGSETARRGGISGSFVCSTATQLPLKSDTFDAVVAAEIVEHLSDARQFLSECWRVLRPEGRILITTPFRLTEKPLDKEHYREYFPDELERMLGEHRFGGVRVNKSQPLFFRELYTTPVFNKPLLYYLINLLSVLGHNVFQSPGKHWHYHAMFAICARKKGLCDR